MKMDTVHNDRSDTDTTDDLDSAKHTSMAIAWFDSLIRVGIL